MLAEKLRDIGRARKTVVVCSALLAETGWDADTYTATTADTRGGVGSLWVVARLEYAWETRLFCGFLLRCLRINVKLRVTPRGQVCICVSDGWYAHTSLESRLQAGTGK